MKILFWILVFMVIYQFFIKPARRPVEPEKKPKREKPEKKQIRAIQIDRWTS